MKSMTTVTDDIIKLNYLEDTLNYKIKKVIINVSVSTLYLKLTQLLYIISSHLNNLQHESCYKDKKSKDTAYNNNK